MALVVPQFDHEWSKVIRKVNFNSFSTRYHLEVQANPKQIVQKNQGYF